ncbi:MAG: hypothetical protein ABIS01_13620, partial [Ferruginibacter sp.]
MKYLFLNQLFLLFFCSFMTFAQTGKFSFTIPSAATTSAGVFKNDSILVRTLWSDEKYTPGTYTNYWDGKDDYGKKLSSPASIYTIKVLSNNVKYTWDGTIGNSSDNMTGPTKHRGYYECMSGLAFGSTYGYFTNGYSEGFPSIGKFKIGTPNQKLFIFSNRQSNAVSTHVATDGINVYWGAYGGNTSFVYGTTVSNDLEISFPNKVNFTPPYGRSYKAIGVINQVGSLISGLAVQKTGNYLFIARSGINSVQVLNKTTGALIQTLTYASPRGISVDGSDDLWMATGTNTVAKYSVNPDGTLTAPILSLPGLLSPLNTQVSPDDQLVSVLDGSTSQQVKSFSNSRGAAANILGVAGGYFSDATVNNNKFYFNDVNGNKATFIAYQPDGSFWVNDPGNFRVQHYDSQRTFIDRIMSLGATYGVYTDFNDITKVFSSNLEFEIDYSQPLTGTTGWLLKRNWGANISTSICGNIAGAKTLSNKRTYA